MIRQTFVLAVRALIRFKGYALINVFGLGLGLAAAALIMVFVIEEASFDKFHRKRDRIYRVNTVFSDGENLGGQNETNAWPIGDVLRREFPEVEAVLYTRSAWNLMIEYEQKKIRQRIFYTSPEFFQMFSFELLEGRPEDVLTRPYSIVISESMEKKYFTPGTSVGKTLLMNDTLEFMVTGVMRDMPANSHMQLDMLASFATFEQLNSDFSYTEGWGNINMRNYVLLQEGADFRAFEAKSKNIYNDKAGEMLKNWGMRAQVAYEPLSDIYLKTRAGNGMGPVGSLTTVYVLSGAGVFVLLLACINFVNLATARSMHRAREVGVKKVVGSSRAGLIRQFLAESMSFTLLAALAALFMVGLFLPFFNELLQKDYHMSAFLAPEIIVGITALVAVVSLLAGYYPAWVLSGLKPSEVLKGRGNPGSRSVSLRKVLVIVQFTVSATLISGTLVIRNQLNYMLSQDLGFTRDQILVINIAQARSPVPGASAAMLNDLRSQSMVRHVTFCNALPAVSGWRGQIAYPEGATGDQAVDMEYMAIDENYLAALDLQLVAGRNFEVERTAELEEGLLINETAVRALGWATPGNAIGREITSPSGFPAGKVIGVVRDFHDMGLQQAIPPMAMDYSPRNSYLYAIRYSAPETVTLLSSLEKVWKEYFPQNDFNYFFMDETFAAQYRAERRMALVFTVFSGVAILIAVVGLFGLVSFFITAKTKEVGIRKVMGASVPGIMRMLSQEFVRLVLIANLISIPASYYFAEQWLQGFAHRMEPRPVIFVATLGIAVLVTLLTVSIQTLRAANANPVKALRYE